jgi:FKBP-type peptidyl-prolyl cis-trans isomerase FklB
MIMKQAALTLFFSFIAVAPVLADSPAPSTATATNIVSTFKNERQQASYALGMMLGHNFQQQGVDMDFDTFARGFKEVQSGGTTLLTPQQMQETLNDYKKTIAARQQQMREEQTVTNKAAGEKFLAENKNKKGIKILPVTLPDGKISELQYKIIAAGNGATPGSNDIVQVNYQGTLLDGTEFDSSYKRGQPAQFPVGAVIRGWTEALQKMKVGSKWQLFIPADLAYGEQGRPGIPPNSTLIFEVELLSTKPAPTAASPNPMTSDIIAVPSAAELKNGKQPYTLKSEDVQKMQKQLQQTNR